MCKRYAVIHHGKNLYDYKMRKSERALVEDLRQECMRICDSLEIPRDKRADEGPYTGRLKANPDFQLKYKKEIGYFILDGERSLFRMRAGFPEMDRERAKFRVLTYEFLSGGVQYVLENRSDLEQAWSECYSAYFDPRKAIFEYAIQMHKKSGSCFTGEVTVKYTELMNRWFKEQHWSFNDDAGSFEENV